MSDKGHMKVQNFQHRVWKRFWTTGIYNLFERATFVDRGINVSFSPANPAEFIKRKETQGMRDVIETLRINICAETASLQSLSSKMTLEDIPFLDIPVFTQDGFIINGSSRGLLSDLAPASGWYMERVSDKLCVLSLKCGPSVVFTITYNSAKNTMLLESSFNKHACKAEPVNVLEFLKAMSPAMNYGEIMKSFANTRIMLEQYTLCRSTEGSNINAAKKVAAVLVPSIAKYDSVVETLQLRFYNNTFNIGPERKPRFENFMSFTKVIGTVLAETVTVGDITIEPGTVLTAPMIKLIEDENIKSLNVIYNNTPYRVYKIPVEDNITFEELICVVYHFCQFCQGLGVEDKQDNYCNKVLAPVDAEFEKIIEKEINTVSAIIREGITSMVREDDFGSLEGIVNNNLLNRSHDAEAFKRIINTRPNYTQLDETNSVAQFGQAYQITRASSTKNQPAVARDVQKSQRGRVCPYATSESAKVGINLSLSTLADIDEYGFVCTPYLLVRNGVVTTVIENLSPIQERGKLIAAHTEDLKDGRNKGEIIQCKLNGDDVTATVAEINYQELSQLQVISPLIALIPSAERNAGKRLLMAVSAQRQAIPTWRRERPWISTGVEAVTNIGVTTARDIIRSFLELQDFYDEVIPEDTLLQINSIEDTGSVNRIRLSTTHPKIAGDHYLYIPRMNATMKGTPKHKRINLTPRNANGDVEYALDDVVIYNNDIDNRRRNVAGKDIDLGNIVCPKEDIANHSAALGSNIKVLFKSWDGSGYEDSIIVNEDFVSNYGMSILTTRKVVHECGEGETFYYQTAGADTSGHMLPSGLPCIGFFLKAGQDIIGRRVERDGQVRYPTKKLSAGEKGWVISAEITGKGKFATVILGDLLHLEPGDKLAGFHGNKGVIGRIVPNHLMPFTEDGEVPDVILNPLGVMSRNNLGQMIEHTLAFKGATDGEIQILPPFSGSTVKEVIEASKASGFKEKIIYDGRTGRRFDQKAAIGYMHFLRLEHIATSKFNACSDGDSTRNRRTMQPNRGPGGGQRVSELCTWCLNAYGANTLLDTLFTVQSDDIKNKELINKRIRAGESTEDVPYESNNLGLMEAYFRLLGLNIIKDEKGARVENLTEQQILDLSNGNCDLSFGDSTQPNKEYHMLRDPRVFGQDMQSSYNALDSRKLYGRLELLCEMIMPIWLHSRNFTRLIHYFDNRGGEHKLKPLTPVTVSAIMDGKLYLREWIEDSFATPEEAKYFTKNYKVPSGFIPRFPVFENVTDAPDINAIPRKRKGIQALLNVFLGYDVASSILATDRELGRLHSPAMVQYLRNNTENISPQEREHIQYVLTNMEAAKGSQAEPFNKGTTESVAKNEKRRLTDTVKTIELRNMTIEFATLQKLKDYVVRSIAVPPIGYRPEYQDAPATAMDVQLKKTVSAVRTVRRAEFESNEYYDAIQLIYETLEDMRKGDAGETQQKTVFMELIDHENNTSVIRDTALSKRIGYSGRSVIAVNSQLKIGECGVPIPILAQIFEEHIISQLFKQPQAYSNLIGAPKGIDRGDTKSRRAYKNLVMYIANNNINGFAELTGITKDVHKRFSECKLELRDILVALLEVYMVVLNREPSLHKFSISGFKGIPVDSYAIQLHPLACHGFNADFDGDQMAVAIAIHAKANEEVKNKMMMQDNLINPKNCDLICSINQDMILGLYYATKQGVTTQQINKLKAMYKANMAVENQYSDMCPNMLEGLYDDIMLGVVSHNDIVSVTVGDDLYINTAGRVLFNAMYSDLYGFSDFYKLIDKPELVGDETLRYSQYMKERSKALLSFGAVTDDTLFDNEDYAFIKEKCVAKFQGKPVKALWIDEVMNKDTINLATKAAVLYYQDYLGMRPDARGDTLGHFLDRIKDLGFWMADYSGITLSLYDFERLPITSAVDSSMGDVEKVTGDLQQLYDLGYITEEERQAQVIKHWTTYKKSLFKGIDDALHGRTNKFGIEFDTKDNIHMMVASGARGSTAQLMEIAGIIGNVTNASGNMMETPIKSNYMNGLTVSEAFNNSYTARRQVMAAQLATAGAGELTRRLVYMAEHLRTSEIDTVCNASSTDLQLEYNITTACTASSELVFTDIEAIPNSIWADASQQFGGSIEDSRKEYADFCSKIEGLYTVPIMSEEIKRALSINRPNFVVARDGASYRMYPIQYKLSNKCRYMLQYRTIDWENMEYGQHLYRLREASVNFPRDYKGIDQLYGMAIISEEMIEAIEEMRLSTIKIFTILGCESTDGICPRCYGIKYDSKSFPEPGEYIGHQAVQSIGEPTAQLVLDAHKRTETDDGSSALAQLNQLLEKPNSTGGLTFATKDGVLSIQDDDEGTSQLCLDGEVLMPYPGLNKLKVLPGTPVIEGQRVIDGKTNYSIMADHVDFTKVQVEMWEDFLAVFGDERIMARNFELIARSQSEFGVALENKGKYLAGKVYAIQDLLIDKVPNVRTILKREDAISTSRKVMTSIAHSYFLENASKHVVQGTISLETSNIGRSMIGDLLTAPYQHPVGVIVPQPKVVYNQAERKAFVKTISQNHQPVVKAKTLMDYAVNLDSVTQVFNTVHASMAPQVVQDISEAFDSTSNKPLDKVDLQEDVVATRETDLVDTEQKSKAFGG